MTSLYAMTETFAVTMFTPEDSEAKGASAGKPRGLAELQIVGDDDDPLPVGEVGEICVRPLERGIMMSGYYKMPEATVRDTRDLWLHTGDRGRLDSDGYLYFVDRKKEAIRRRGENISAYEVEMLIARHPSVLEVAAVPVASELSEDEVMIYVVCREGHERQRGRAGALRQPQHGAFHGAALRPLHRGVAQDREREDREIQAQDLG